MIEQRLNQRKRFFCQKFPHVFWRGQRPFLRKVLWKHTRAKSYSLAGRSREVAPTQRLRATGPAPAPRGQKSSLPVRVRKRDLVCGAIVRGNARSIEPKEVFKFRSKLNFQISNFQFQTNSKFEFEFCLLYTSPSPRDRTRSRMPSSA